MAIHSSGQEQVTGMDIIGEVGNRTSEGHAAVVLCGSVLG